MTLEAVLLELGFSMEEAQSLIKELNEEVI